MSGFSMTDGPSPKGLDRCGDAAPTPARRLPHNAAVIQQYETTSTTTGWGSHMRTGLACLVCNCGAITGWLRLAEVEALAAEHRIELD